MQQNKEIQLDNYEGLLAVHRQWAIWTFRRFKFLYPEFSQKLYGDNWIYTIHIENYEGDSFEELQQEFDNRHRPITLHISLSQVNPSPHLLINVEIDYSSEMWLVGAPLPALEFNDLLSLAAPNFPHGGLDFDNSKDCWIFQTAGELTTEQMETLKVGLNRIGVTGTVEVKVIPLLPNDIKTNSKTNSLRADFNLTTSRRFKANTLRGLLVQQDEDNWRQFLDRRSNQSIIEDNPSSQSNFSCLYDPEHCGESRLSELLTIYDQVNILLGLDNQDWLRKHQLSTTDLQELVQLNKIRLVLPHSITQYTSNLIETVAEVDRTALILSRDLATKTIIRGQKKQPLIYAPLTAEQRSSLLSALYHATNDISYKAFIKSYGEIYLAQHDMFMLRGAVASVGSGVGAYLGEVFRKLSGIDAALELMTCGAGVEWAMALGSSYIPRVFGEYDETKNSYLVASFLGRTNAPQANPVANRIHNITEGLLAVSNVPPLEVAKSLRSTQVALFRELANKLISGTLDEAEFKLAIQKINLDVKAFESKTNRLSKWHFGTLASGLAVLPIDELGPMASPIAAWIYEILRSKLPDNVNDKIEFSKSMVLGLATGATVDTVIVSRTRNAISNSK